MHEAREWERLAVLEERSESQRTQIGELVEALHSLTKEVTRIGHQLEHSVGFLGGVAFTFSLLGAVIGVLGSIIARKWS